MNPYIPLAERISNPKFPKDFMKDLEELESLPKETFKYVIGKILDDDATRYRIDDFTSKNKECDEKICQILKKMLA